MLPSITPVRSALPPIVPKPIGVINYQIPYGYANARRTHPYGWRRTSKQDRDGAWYFALDDGNSADWEARKAEWERKKAEREENQRQAKQEEFKTSLTANSRDKSIRALSAELSLTREHRQILRDRGLTDEQIDDGLFFSIASWQEIGSKYPLNLPGVKQTDRGVRFLATAYDDVKNCYVGGIAVVTLDRDRLATGWQLMTVPRIEGKKYIWAKGEKSSHLPVSEGELPLQVVGIPESVANLTEGTLKPKLAFAKHGGYFVGASSGNFVSSPTLTTLALEGSSTVIINVDGGDAINSHRVKNWRSLCEFLESIEKFVLFRWWGQICKDSNDIDEISPEQFKEAELIEPDRFFRMCERELRKIEDRKIFDQLSSLTLPITDQRNEPELSNIPIPRTGHFTFVDSGVATGKTKQLEKIVTDWERVFGDGKVLSLGYRNGLLRQQKTRLGIPHIEEVRVGHGLSNLSINHAQKLALCLDSILEINIDDISSNTLVIHDELEAILSHAALGQTLGGRIAEVQAHLVKIYHRVLSTGGAAIGLEDSITDVSVKGLLDLTDNKYPYEIISNSAEKFDWDVSIAGGSKADFISLIISRLKAGERICLTTTSQRFGEILERIALDRVPELAGKIERIDSRTISDLKDSELLTEPTKYLQSRDVRLLILSPTVESGFSILNGGLYGSPLFDRVMAYFVNLDTRSHIQLLSRYRSNCPREIYALDRGAEAGKTLSRNPDKLNRIYKRTANITSLGQGFGRIQNTPSGEVWNRVAAQFKARSALSSQYLREYLEIELRDRGHRVTEADWGATAAAVALSHGLEIPDPQSLKLDFATIVEELEASEAQELAQADIFALSDGKPDPKKATAILHSSSATNNDRLRARKTILTDELPGAELSTEFLLEAVVKRRGAYRRECELAWFLDKPKLAKAIDREFFTNQLEKPHLIYSRVPKLAQQVDLLAPIADYAHELASREYSEGDEVVEKFNDYLLKHPSEIYFLFGLHIKPTTIDTKGRRQNTAIANVNKVMRKLGYESEESRREGGRGEQKQWYIITNFNCPHRETIYDALEEKYREYLNKDDHSSEVETIFNKDLTILENVTTGTQTQAPRKKPTHPPPPPPSGYRVGDWVELGDEQVKVVAIGQIYAIGQTIEGEFKRWSVV